MGRYSLILLAVVTLFLTGCLRSVNPFYNPDDVIFDPDLLGEWKSIEDEDEAAWCFTEGANGSYELSFTGIEFDQGIFKVHLASFQGITILDLYPQIQPYDWIEAPFFYYHLYPCHSFFVVDELNPTRLGLHTLDIEWLKWYLLDHPDVLKHGMNEERYPILTASTDELQDFIVKHLNNKEAWGEVEALILKRKID